MRRRRGLPPTPEHVGGSLELFESQSAGGRTPSDGNSNGSGSDDAKSEGGDSVSAGSWDQLLGNPGGFAPPSRRRNSKSPSRARMLIERLTSTNSSSNSDSHSDAGSEHGSGGGGGGGEAPPLLEDGEGDPPAQEDLSSRLLQLQAARENGLLSEEEYAAARAEAVRNIVTKDGDNAGKTNDADDSGADAP